MLSAHGLALGKAIAVERLEHFARGSQNSVRHLDLDGRMNVVCRVSDLRQTLSLRHDCYVHCSSNPWSGIRMPLHPHVSLDSQSINQVSHFILVSTMKTVIYI